MANEKIKAYFSRLVPFYLIHHGETDDSAGFDAYPVEVDPRIMELAAELRELERGMLSKFDEMPAPEEAAQEEADVFSAEVFRIIGNV